MRLFADIEPSSYKEIQKLVAEGKYESVEQFLQVAAHNQLAIERSDDNGPDISPDEPQEKTFHWEYTPPQKIPTGPPFGDYRDSILLFSQYYRFFPLKCALYKISELTAKNNGPVPLEEAKEYVADEIWPIRNQISKWEDMNNIKKQNRKSTGFPKDKDQSMMRYLDHYVGKIQTQKENPVGFGQDLGYVSFQQDGMDWEIQLTLTGARFVQIPNPLLSDGIDEPTLGEKEQAFIVTTIRNDLDEEYRFMKYIYDVLKRSGDESYTTYMDEYREFLEDSLAAPDDLSDNSVRSTTGGAISRMVELGILERGRRRGWYQPRRHPDEYESIPIEV